MLITVTVSWASLPVGGRRPINGVVVVLSVC